MNLPILPALDKSSRLWLGFVRSGILLHARRLTSLAALDTVLTRSRGTGGSSSLGRTRAHDFSGSSFLTCVGRGRRISFFLTGSILVGMSSEELRWAKTASRLVARCRSRVARLVFSFVFLFVSGEGFSWTFLPSDIVPRFVILP